LNSHVKKKKKNQWLVWKKFVKILYKDWTYFNVECWILQVFFSFFFFLFSFFFWKLMLEHVQFVYLNADWYDSPSIFSLNASLISNYWVYYIIYLKWFFVCFWRCVIWNRDEMGYELYDHGLNLWLLVLISY
jgi:hypothetical protein